MPTALITGASRGIGETTARLFSEKGWDLLLTSRDSKKLQDLAAELSSNGGKVLYQPIDLCDTDVIDSGIKTLLKEGSSPSVLINNAGVAWTGNLLSMSLENWEWLMQVNLNSVFQVCSLVVPYMRKQGGMVINVSSHASRNAFPQWGAYCVSKAALASFTKCLAEEERVNRIRACTLTLGSVNTTIWDSDTVQSNFDRRSMLSSNQAASALLHLAEQPYDQIIEDLTLMPASGAF
tara:strand:+ start:205 stop:912 length:708 start_codon:yes stop_codon:yes gene_type:complete